MSAASTPTPYPGSSYEGRSSSNNRYTVFWPMLILLIGISALSLYQVISMQNRLDEATQAVEKLDNNVKRSLYERKKFAEIAKDLLRLAPTNSNADQIVTYFKLRELQTAQPALLSLDKPSSADASQPAANTSLAPAPASTNTAPETLPGLEPGK